MNKTYLSFLALVGVAGAAIFWEDVAAYFRGMSPLEAVKIITTYLLHLAVGTVAAVVIFGLPKIIQPWMRYFKRHQKNKWRSGPNAQWQQRPPRMPRLTAEQKFWLMMARANQAGGRQSARPNPRPLPQGEGEKLNIKW